MPSAVIKTYQYFPDSQTLRIYYNSGAVYDYLEVPQEVFNEFRAFTAKGIFLNKHIKNRYISIKLEV